MNEWKAYKLGEICDVRDGTHDSPKECSYGKPLVTSKNIKEGRIDLENTYLISDDDYNLVNQRSKVDMWDVLFSMIGTIGECAIVKDIAPFAIKNVGLFKTGGNELLAKWIYYYFQSKIAKAEINAKIKGSTQQYISLGDLRSFPVLLPTIEVQRNIIGVLECLDDKIVLLHRENKTLEAMAETLFRKWFIEGIKEDWKEGTLDDVLSVKGGTTPSTKEPKYWDGSILWTSPKDVTTLNGIYLFDTERKITQEGLKQISSGLLPAGTLLMSSRAPVGVLAYAEVPLAINQGYIAIIDNKGYAKEFIYLWLKANMDMIHSYANGSTFMEISKSAFKSLSLLIPPKHIVDEFCDRIKPIFEKIKINELQIRAINKTKDNILPKLMSNEIKINEL